jgi:hypothetical protein
MGCLLWDLRLGMKNNIETHHPHQLLECCRIFTK